MGNESRHILIAEDDVGMAELFSMALTERGYQCQAVHSAEDCLNRVERSRPDLLLLDYALPEMQGAALVEQLARTGNLPPFLVITGHGDEQVAVRMMKLGARDYLVKDALLLDRLPLTVSRVFKELENERRLAEAEQSLLEGERRYRSLVENVPDVVMRFDRECRHRFVSPAVARYGLPPAEAFLGKTHREMGFPKQECVFWERAIQGVIDSCRPLETEFEARGVIFNCRLMPELDQAAQCATVLSIARDITERKAAEDRMAQQFEELRRWQDLTLGRESRILELKREVNDLLARAGQSPRYSATMLVGPNAALDRPPERTGSERQSCP